RRFSLTPMLAPQDCLALLSRTSCARKRVLGRGEPASARRGVARQDATSHVLCSSLVAREATSTQFARRWISRDDISCLSLPRGPLALARHRPPFSSSDRQVFPRLRAVGARPQTPVSGPR